MIRVTVAATMGMLLMGSVAASATPTTGHIKAVVVKVAPVATGGAYVTLSAIAPNSSRMTARQLPVRYAWDLTTDGVFETPLSVNPMTTQYYGPTASGMVTATLRAIGGATSRGQISHVSFSLITSPATPLLKAVVVKVAHVATGGAYVTLSVITPSAGKNTATVVPMRYSWDLTTDGVFETPLSVNPTITQFYAQTASGFVTATVKRIGDSPIHGAIGSVTFSMLP
jgi:hypothetical protein